MDCDGPITIDDATLKEVLELGKPLTPRHEKCPEVQDPNMREFHLVIQMFEVTRTAPDPNDEDQSENVEEELVAQFGGNVKAVSFKEAVPGLLKELNQGWEQVQQMAPVVDGG